MSTPSCGLDRHEGVPTPPTHFEHTQINSDPRSRTKLCEEEVKTLCSFVSFVDRLFFFAYSPVTTSSSTFVSFSATS